MEEYTIKHLIDTFRTIDRIEHSDMPMIFSLSCTVSSPVAWNKRKLENELNITIPLDLEKLWNEASSLRLFEDTTYGQWGLIIWSPDQIVEQQKLQAAQKREQDFRRGDLIIGRFLGDLELPILRCDPASNDFGRVIIALEIYHRSEWYTAAESLTVFLRKFLEARGEKFWER